MPWRTPQFSELIWPFGLPYLLDYAAFIRALGSEAKALRRLTIVVYRDVSDPNIDYLNDVQGSLEWNKTLDVGDAEAELETLRDLLHPDITILLAMKMQVFAKKMQEPFDYRTDYFHCNVSKDSAKVFTARKLKENELDQWQDYTDHIDMSLDDFRP